MLKWLRERSLQERLMLALIALLVIGIVVRWAWVSDEVKEAWRERFTAPAPASTEQAPADTPADGQATTGKGAAEQGASED